MLLLTTITSVMCFGFYFYFAATVAQFSIFDYHFWGTLGMCYLTGYGFVVSLSSFLYYLIPS